MQIKIEGTPEEIKELLQVIRWNKKQPLYKKCVVCSESSEFDLENGESICETCAQIQGELDPS